MSKLLFLSGALGLAAFLCSLIGLLAPGAPLGLLTILAVALAALSLLVQHSAVPPT